MDYSLYFKNHIANIRHENRYRNFIPLVRLAEEFPYAYNVKTKEKITLWCINDYLGMSQHPAVLKAASNAIQYGVGSGGTRNIGGNSNSIIKLENTLAKLHSKEKSLLFTSGYVANDATITSLSKIIPDLVLFSDELNHASIISGISHSRLQKHIYKHNDINDLEMLLSSVDINQPKMILFESVYSMNGQIAPVREICQLAKKYNAMTYIDEVHSVGLYGDKGAGIAKMFGCDDQIDILQGTLSKAYGVIGGYIAGNQELIDGIRLSARGFIFTTSLPPLIAEAARASIEYLANSDLERNQIHSNGKKVKLALKKAGINFINNNSHIIAVGVGDALLAEQISTILLEKHKLYIQHINFPTVPKGTERLRIVPTSGHNEIMIQHLMESLQNVFEELGIKKSYQVA